MGATSYTVSRATTSGGPYTVLSRQPGTTYADNGLTPGSTYYYVVTATTSIGTSANSTEASGTTLAQPVAPVATATVASTTSVHVAWSAVTATGSTGPTTYDVYSATTSGGPYTLKAVLTTTLAQQRPDPRHHLLLRGQGRGPRRRHLTPLDRGVGNPLVT